MDVCILKVEKYRPQIIFYYKTVLLKLLISWNVQIPETFIQKMTVSGPNKILVRMTDDYLRYQASHPLLPLVRHTLPPPPKKKSWDIRIRNIGFLQVLVRHWYFLKTLAKQKPGIIFSNAWPLS